MYWKHEIACTSWSSCLWKLCELVSNIEQLCIVFMYTRNLSNISTISQFESDSKMCTFHLILKCICVWCLDNWSRILSGKSFNTFSMARLKTLQFRLTLTPLFTATHAFFFLSFTIFFMICDWGSPSILWRRILFILVTLDLSLLWIHHDLWNSQKWQILISNLQSLS